MRTTHILSACHLREWGNVSQSDREFYLTRGTAIHLATQLFDQKKLVESSVDERIKGFLDGYKKFRREVGGNIKAIEKKLKHKTLGYTGRLDRIFGTSNLWRGDAVIDIKTNEADVATRLQLMAYAMCLRGKYLRGAVSLFNNGTYKVTIYNQDAQDKRAWLACVALTAWRERNGYINAE